MSEQKWDIENKTQWHCEVCGKSGVIETQKGLDFWSGYWQLVDAHRKISPNCEFRAYQVKIAPVVQSISNQSEGEK